MPEPKPDPVPVLEVGGSHVTAAVVHPDESVDGLVRATLDPHGSATAIVGTLIATANRLMTTSTVWAAAVPGPFDYETGIARYRDVGKFDDLDGFDLRGALVDGIRSRPHDVRFINDAHAFALGEWTAGLAAGRDRLVGITLGTGIGSGWVDRGRIVTTGDAVPPDARLDLMRIDGRPLEDVVSTRAIVANYRARGRESDDVRAIATLAAGGDAVATDVIDTAMRRLGEALAPWLRRFDAEALVVGGSMTRSWDVVTPGLRTGLGALAGILVRGDDTERAALRGAASIV